jgi:thioredoxin reductase
MYDVIIVGGGPAGLSAALVLGRCRRSVLLCDSGKYRNDASPAMHGFLSRDGVAPAEMRHIGREQLAPYDVEIRDVLVTDARKEGNHFEVSLAGGDTASGRKLLLATGLVDWLPDIPGLRELYGKSVHHCPYCDGWEQRDEPVAVHGRGDTGVGLALALLRWTADVVLCTDGPAELSAEDAERLARNGIEVRQGRITRLEGSEGRLALIHFEDGDSLARSAMFLEVEHVQRSNLAAKLGCEVDSQRGVRADGKWEETCIEGVFIAGDASLDLRLAIVAAAEGAKAAFGVNKQLSDEEMR